jgi:hypothetical protein
MTDKGFKIWFGLVAALAITIFAGSVLVMIFAGGKAYRLATDCQGVQLVHRIDGGADTYSVECK